MSGSHQHSATASTTKAVVDPARGDHYGKMKMEPIDFIIANDMDFLAGNAIKYVTRGALGESPDLRLIDLRKAKDYVQRMIDREYLREPQT